MKNKNKELLVDFTNFCEKHSEQRFWQALRAWSEMDSVWVSKDGGMNITDTYYWENKNR